MLAEGAVFLEHDPAETQLGVKNQGKAAFVANAFHPCYRFEALSPFTTFRHSVINRLHASWQSRGTVAGIVDPG